MENDELEMCKQALADIIAVCDSHKGLADSYQDKEEESEPAVSVEIDAAPEAREEAEEAPPMDDLPPPISVIDRPGAKAPLNVKRGRGRPRKDRAIY